MDTTKQILSCGKLTSPLGVDYLNGDVCYAYESEGSITDKSVYPHLMMDHAPTTATTFRTRLSLRIGATRASTTSSGYSILKLNYVCGVPLTEESVKQLFERYKSSLSNPAFLNGRLKVAARSSEELWGKGH